jgi:hypothetical protein
MPSARRRPARTFNEMFCWFRELQPKLTVYLKEMESTLDHGEASLSELFELWRENYEMLVTYSGLGFHTKARQETIRSCSTNARKQWVR